MSSRMTDVLTELRRIGAVSAPPPVKFLPPEPEPVAEPEPPADSPLEDSLALDEGAVAVMAAFQKPFEEDDKEDAAEESSSEDLEDDTEDDEDSDEDFDEDSAEALLDDAVVLKEALERLAMLEAGIADLRALLAAMLAAKEE